MSLDTIAAVAAAHTSARQKRHSPPPSDSTDLDSDPSESDSSAHVDASPSPPQKKRRSELTADDKAEEAEVNFPAEMLLDLSGSTSAEVRRMNEDERALVHYKRRLRNRESAKRSRARRQATLSDIQTELEDLRQVTASLLDRCVTFARCNDRQGQELETLRKEKQLLESMLRSGSML